MHKLLIFGASRGTGQHLVQFAIHADIPCTALVRDTSSAQTLAQAGVHVIQGDALDKKSVINACKLAGQDCTVVSTIGGNSANYDGNRTIINAAEQCGLKRLLLVTSLGCGNSWAYLSEPAKAAFGFSVREKTLAESWLQTSTLDYCILRPGGLLSHAATHQAQCYGNEEHHGFVTRADLAEVILTKTQQAALGHKIYTVIDPSLKPVSQL